MQILQYFTTNASATDMTEPSEVQNATAHDEDTNSFFALCTTLLRNRRRIAYWTLAGGTLAALTVISKPQLYVGSASFFSLGAETSRSSLSNLAGQFGVLLSQGNQSSSPDFYVKLLNSRALFQPLVLDTLVVSELGGKRISFLDLFKVAGDTQEEREENGVKLLIAMVTPTVAKTTGIVELSVATKWRSVSLALVSALIDEINEFNRHSRQKQAETEKKFVEQRLALAKTELSEVEGRMVRFQSTNRVLSNSPELNLERERIRREIDVRQQIFLSVTQAYEDLRIREVRDVPTIAIFEAPAVPTEPAARGRLIRTALGLALGGLIGVLLAFTSDMFSRLRMGGDPDVDEFVRTLTGTRDELLSIVHRARGRARE